jgi:hypothetical protein
MGRGETAIFRIVTQLEDQAGALINVNIGGRLKGRGVEGAEVLEGNEEDMDLFTDQIRVTWRRNGVVVPKSTSYATEIDLLNVARPALRDWLTENLRDGITASLSSIIVPGTADAEGMAGVDTAVAYASATATQRNTFLTNNTDRVLFGSARGNASSNVWATALGNVDSTNDRMGATVIDLATRMARRADPRITPFRTEDGREYFVLFTPSEVFRDARADTRIETANRDARARGIDNPIFQGGDLIWNGVIIREIPELPVLTGVGAAGIDVGLSYLCGRSAVGIAYGQQPTPRTDLDRDYKFRPGVAIEELRGQKKLSREGKQIGMVTIATSATPDA